MEADDTPIEILVAALMVKVKCHDVTILVPEQCAEVFIGAKRYHVTIEELVEAEDKSCIGFANGCHCEYCMGTV